MAENPLKYLIVEEIRRSGPMALSRYMELCLTHPQYGYYTTRDPFGIQGDFVTAPEISQIFGELVGLWAADWWTRSRISTPLSLMELGPGRGTLMADALRTLRALPGPAPAVTLVETSPHLRKSQAERLGNHPNLQWLDSVNDVPGEPAIIIANEFFDALPIDQTMFHDGAWRQVRIDECEGTLMRDMSVLDNGQHPDGKPQAIVETCPQALDIVAQLSRHVVQNDGAVLIVDYGYADAVSGDTLQALQGGAYADALTSPGKADLTAHVDFSALGRAATNAGASVYGPVPQGDFLARLGIAARAEALKARASPMQRREIDLAIHRLTAPDQMGTLFKAMAIAGPTGPEPAGFSS